MKRILSCLTVLALLFTLIVPCFAAGENSSVIYIKTAKDLMELSEKCTLDTWSQSKTVLLENDIDLADEDYKSIPVFSGTFDGQGHTVKNLKIDYSGSDLGLFRHIGSGGQVKNLSVTGSVSPDGIKENIGGIAGHNSGSIIFCTFTGNVDGESKVGGITGLNDSTGIITDCTFSGSVTGKTKVGGIAGENDGNIFSSSNSADVNTIPVEFSASTVIGSVLDTKSVSDMNEISDTVKDIGGIAGYSSGSIRKCTNSGTVGYIHIGYNVGGIAGRQSGNIKDSTNSGTVYGRRNTGGIAGEMEPYTSWVVSNDSLDELRTELDTLQDMTNNLLDDVKSQSSTLSDQFDDSITQLNAAEESLDSLITSTTDFVNGNVDSINEVSVRISDFISGTEKVTDEIAVFCDDLEKAVGEISDFSDELKLAVDDGIKPSLDCLSDAGAILSDGMREMESALEEVSDGFAALERSLGDTDAMYRAMQDLAASFEDLSYAVSATGDDVSSLIDKLYDDGTYYYDSFLNSLNSSLSDLNYYLNNLSSAVYDIAEAIAEALATGDFSILQAALEDFADNIRNSADSLYDVIHSFIYLTEGMRSMLDDLKVGIPPISNDLDSLSNALADVSSSIGSVIGEVDVRALGEALDDFSIAMDTMAGAFGSVSEATDRMNDGKEYADIALDHISTAFGAMSKASDSMTTAASSLSNAADAASSLVSDFAAKEPVKFVKIDDSFTTAQDNLFDSLKKLSDSVNILVDTASSDILVNDLRALSDQIFKTFGKLIDIVDSVSDVSTDPEAYKDDISSENEKYSTGVISGSANHGKITSDYNSGGIVGNISIEISIDLENDLNLSGIFSKSAKHLIYAVVSDCESYSDIEVKYNNAGGIVGNMDYGYVKSSKFAGSVLSDSGDYIGGIAGYSDGSISSCLSRVNLSGKNYIGGIAGRGNNVSSSCAVTYVDSAGERAGSIVGSSSGDVTENYFLDSSALGGIDGISYAGKAEPVTYEELLTKTDSSEIFAETTVTFIKDGETVAVLNVPFGGRVDELPEIPDKDGMYWVWDSFDREAVYSNIVVEGSYRSPLTTISTDEDVPLFLVEGEFYTEQKLTVSEWTPDLDALGIEHEGTYAAYKLSVSDYTDDLTVRMRHSDSGKLYVMNDGVPEEIKFTTDGSYIVFKVKNNSSFVFVDSSKVSHKTAVIIASSCAAAVVAGAVTTVIVVRKKKKSKTK